MRCCCFFASCPEPRGAGGPRATYILATSSASRALQGLTSGTSASGCVVVLQAAILARDQTLPARHRESAKMSLGPSGFSKVTERKAMRFVTARTCFVIVAAGHATRFLDARIRRIFGRRVERRFLDVWPRRSVVVRGGAAALRVLFPDATGASRSSPSAGVDPDDRAGSGPGPMGVQDDEESMCGGGHGAR